ncbi:ImmA/IrrE family metallo-endopeptidase [Riemerella anatipestifer]|nr:ImmA/IrrE family metallo-endopeptidase [Riemerella anatipestifer]MCO7332794.1 ImmA/IrrE family metallo-endopeptidase [Riemerella anatipestifer]MCO7351684.1 ImmA/IrrE family metallo-endopeptidase [Riemerella anatipestifer]MCU7582293.1 ImmA/IrrE family metallo-endopeptidase [Riemerella anatipestifer]MCW0493385.1 ImmA/IrrE family metallo-endopeptidase [Riemerella anatipestifer]MDY3351926.1 ImmA/IrrE family metallo-endopeptidase [Riemerella anatipestifer]
MKVEQNIKRLDYLLSLFNMTIDELLMSINDELKKPITREEILTENIKISHLKRIDRVFNKGLHFYLDPKSPEISKDASIFFRKSKFDADLNIGAKKIVNQFEEFKISLSAISKLAEINTDRVLPVFKTSESPKKTALEIRKILYPKFQQNLREFLKSLISKFAEKNILVFEFIETWNKKEKANIDGFFLNPNVIVLKRQQSSFRREIFTLAHELGHYLLNIEEVDNLEIADLANHNLSKIEKWCNDFAFYFIAGEYGNVIDKLEKASSANDYNFKIIEKISQNTHLSQIAIFTRLLLNNQISPKDYNNVKSDFEEQFRLKQLEEQRQKELDKQNGVKRGGSVPKPINSPLLISTIQTAFYEGVINEFDVCKTLNITPDKLNKYIQ